MLTWLSRLYISQSLSLYVIYTYRGGHDFEKKYGGTCKELEDRKDKSDENTNILYSLCELIKNVYINHKNENGENNFEPIFGEVVKWLIFWLVVDMRAHLTLTLCVLWHRLHINALYSNYILCNICTHTFTHMHRHTMDGKEYFWITNYEYYGLNQWPGPEQSLNSELHESRSGSRPGSFVEARLGQRPRREQIWGAELHRSETESAT